MKSLIATVMATGVALFIATQANAQDVKASIPKAMELPVKAGMKVISKFDVGSGLVGWVVENGTESSVVYTTADGKHLMAGVLFDETGKNLTASFAEKHIAKTEMQPYWEQLEKLTYVAQGSSSKNVMFIFFDPNCVYCNLMWKSTKLFKDVQVKWIPVAYLKDDSAGKAAAIMASNDPSKALTDHETGYASNRQGIAPVKVSPDIQKKLDQNNAMMAKLKIQGTPGIVWKDANGKVLVQSGMMRLRDLAKVLNSAVPETNDPELARFK